MNEEHFKALLELLELPEGSTDDDVLAAVRTIRATMRSLADDGTDSDAARAAILAATSRLSTLTGSATLAGAVTVVEQRFALLAEHEKSLAEEKKKTAALEMADRRALTAELVHLGAEIPATAWSDEKGTIPVQRLLDEPLVNLRDRVERLKAAGGGSPLRPARTDLELTQQQIDACEREGIDPAAFHKMKQRVAAKSARRTSEVSR